MTQLSHGAFAAITRPLIRIDGVIDRAALCRKARSLVMRGEPLPAAMNAAHALARRQRAQAFEYDAARDDYAAAPKPASRRPSEFFPTRAATGRENQ